MNYQESVTYLEQAASFGIKPGLERIQAILEKLGHPETAYRTIHVTGTNGKGSVVAMITSVLENAQLKIGRYVSPHLIDYTERIYVGGHDVTKDSDGLLDLPRRKGGLCGCRSGHGRTL